MRLAANYQRAGNLEQASSIRAALELLSDKEPEEQQGSLIDIETERQARAAAEAQAEAERQARKQAEQDRAEWENRQKESQAEANERRKTIRELETQIDLRIDRRRTQGFCSGGGAVDSKVEREF